MNKYIVESVTNKYGFDPKNASIKDLETVEEIIASDVTGRFETVEWDFSAFPKLKRIDCSFNSIDKIDISNNLLLEEIRWEGVRGDLPSIDVSKNTKLKKIRGGQDGMVELDLSSNIELEVLTLCLNHSMRWINLDNCHNLRQIHLNGINIPFVDLTHCKKLEYMDVNYANLYARKKDAYGPGYPRPIIFVCPDFDETIIPLSARNDKDFNYFLVRTDSGSAEEELLLELKANKQHFIDIRDSIYGDYVAREHYRLLSMIDNIAKR